MTEGQAAGSSRLVSVLGLGGLIAGIVAGLLTLRAVAGVWLDWWDFRQGFQILFGEGSGTSLWTQYVAIACVIVAVIALIAGKASNAANAGRMAVFALVGAAIAFVAYYVPNSYRPSEADNVPPIHDISTDTTDPPVFVDVLPLRADAPNTTEYGRAEGMTPEQLRQLTAEAYGDLVPARLSVPPGEAFDRALAAVRDLGWEIVAEARDEGRIEATDTTFWFRFKDDVVIRIRPDADGSIVDARSLSRVGRGDAGTNARRLREFLGRL